MDSRFTYNPNFCLDSLPQQPQSLGIPHGIREILPAGALGKQSSKIGISVILREMLLRNGLIVVLKSTNCRLLLSIPWGPLHPETNLFHYHITIYPVGRSIKTIFSISVTKTSSKIKHVSLGLTNAWKLCYFQNNFRNHKIFKNVRA